VFDMSTVFVFTKDGWPQSGSQDGGAIPERCFRERAAKTLEMRRRGGWWQIELRPTIDPSHQNGDIGRFYELRRVEKAVCPESSLGLTRW